MNVYARKARAAYLQNELKNLTPELIVVKLYQGLTIRLQAAIEESDAGHGGKRAEHLGWALAMTLELQASLDMEQGGEIAVNLSNLYRYLVNNLVTANRTGDNGKIKESLRVVEPLLAAWTEVAKNGKKAETRPRADAAAAEYLGRGAAPRQAALTY
ncbi:MAG: flagellar export chaperone FliS [Desulfobulbaceae bacterium]|nr:MAG: flagellar export chaperone FliS [Desulfobulbaceae bacterium]